MAERPARLLLVSDFNCANFQSALGQDPDGPPLEVAQAPFGTVEPVLMDPAHESLDPLPDTVVVWTRPVKSAAPKVAEKFSVKR